MSYEARNNTGTLGENDRKEADNQPDRRGKALIDGQWFWISGWDKSNSRGDFISLSFTAMTPDDVNRYGSPTGNTESRRQSDAPGRNGPPRGSYRDNRAARQQPRGPSSKPAPADAPFGEEQHFSPDDVPFAWPGRSTLPL